MKKSIIAMLTAVAMLSSSCISGLGTTSSTSSTTSGLLGLLGNVLLGGGLGLTQSSLVGNWTYSAPSAAFTTQQALNNAGGTGAASALVSSLAPSYQKMGISKKNTSFNFGANNQFSAQVNGIPFNGTYTYNESTGEIVLKSGYNTIKGNVTKTTNGMGLMFDANQMTTMLQSVGKVNNQAAVEAVSKLARSTDGARVGFELTK